MVKITTQKVHKLIAFTFGIWVWFLVIDSKLLFISYQNKISDKEGCNWGHSLSAAIKQPQSPNSCSLVANWPAALKENLCLVPDQKMILPKKVANGLKINLAP